MKKISLVLCFFGFVTYMYSAECSEFFTVKKQNLEEDLKDRAEWYKHFCAHTADLSESERLKKAIQIQAEDAENLQRSITNFRAVSLFSHSDVVIEPHSRVDDMLAFAEYKEKIARRRNQMSLDLLCELVFGKKI